MGECLAEGSGKITSKDKAHYTNMALETLNHIIAAVDLDYITDEEYLTYRSKIENITIKLTGLRNSQINNTNS
ncbi:four helix bundle protein [Pedobacter sp. Bi27]|uniref:four helix bundle protein n=1 Tax=Pedobacter sp. Bi27 TaxID=2822351 RepID=UPI003530099A